MVCILYFRKSNCIMVFFRFIHIYSNKTVVNFTFHPLADHQKKDYLISIICYIYSTDSIGCYYDKISYTTYYLLISKKYDYSWCNLHNYKKVLDLYEINIGYEELKVSPCYSQTTNTAGDFLQIKLIRYLDKFKNPSYNNEVPN